MLSNVVRGGSTCALALALSLVASGTAHAYARGIDVLDCGGCHGGAGRAPMVLVTSIPADPSPGERVTIRVAIEAVNGSRGGFRLSSNGPGSFSMISGQSTRLVGEDAVVHSAPGSASGGWVNFDVSWLAPSEPGDVQLRAVAISANGDGASRGDGAGRGQASVLFGCEGETYYGDLDRDGFGAESRGMIQACSPPEGYARLAGDCDDNDGAKNPAAEEACNDRDDDCDGTIDEGLESVLSYPDADGDGYGGREGEPIMGCGRAGYGVGRGDCDEGDPAINPGATETCNGRDDDCDGDVDERVRPVCGMGWCARAAVGCDLTFCEPGEPRAEMCNAFDDDCDGDIDEGTSLCEGGQACVAGLCGGEIGVDGGTSHGLDGGGGPGPGAGSGGCSATRAASAAPLAIAMIAGGALVVVRRRRR